jgi:hypothetical protein
MVKVYPTAPDFNHGACQILPEDRWRDADCHPAFDGHLRQTTAPRA